MTRIIFIGATGTDIGKTHVTLMLLRQLHDQGYGVRAVKPVISGFEMQARTGSDSGLLLQAMGIDVTPENIKTISPWRFRPALPPHLAAEQAGRPIRLDNIVDFCRKQAQRKQDRADLDFLLVEGVGGIMTPLNYDYTTLDLMARLECHCLLVTGSSLGTLSHTLSAISCIHQRKIILDGLIISESLENYADFDMVFSDFKKLLPEISIKKTSRNLPAQEIFTLVI